MVRLVHFEFRKHFWKKSIVIGLVLFTLFNVAKIYSVYSSKSLLSESQTSSAWKGLYWQMYETFGGEITAEKIKALMKIYEPLELATADLTASTRSDNPDTYTGNVYEDYHFFAWCYVNPMKYAYMYKQMADDIVKAAKNNMTFYQRVGNPYAYEMNADLASRFAGREIPSFSYTEMFQYYVHYDFSVFLLLLLCMYSLMHVFVSEKETEMDALLMTTKAGGVKSTLAKLLAAILFIIALSGWFWIVDFIAFSFFFGSWEAFTTPVYALENFVNASIGSSLGQYALLSAAVKTMGMIVAGLLFLVISSRCKNALLPFIISLTSAFGLIYAQEAMLGSGYVGLKVMNPFILLVNRELFRKTEYVNWFDQPLISYIPAFLLAAAYAAGCIALMFLAARKNRLRSRGGSKHAGLPL
ncbi:ABC transporter permease [Paenibacillus sp. GCM10027626]|uniref:ABC transporter permease n=1 Tax=Paenibacillus sp. GCM10027626 TaxID=3273411 RepID=UPI003636E701